jgi:transcriptional regulator GlxA family with amidase domain
LVPIHRIAAEVGWSHRHFTAQFKQQVGLRPKTAARLVRFDGVWRRLEQHKPLDWADIARDAGYADQAHLIRDFREFAGTTPAELARRLPPRPGRDGRGRGEVNSVQDRAALRSYPRAQWS